MAQSHGDAKAFCTHNCTEPSRRITKRSIKEMGYSEQQVTAIMDFYVSHAICKTCSNKREVTGYGWKGNQSKTEGYPALLNALLDNARIYNLEHETNFAIIYGEKMEKTLFEMGFTTEDKKLRDEICVMHPRIALIGEHNISYDENDSEIVKIINRETDVLCLLRHIRNAFAHSLTFEYNDKLFLVDKNERGGSITACILIRKQTLLDWISIIDKRHIYYSLASLAEERHEELMGAT